MEPIRLEQGPKTAGKAALSEGRGAESGAVDARAGPLPPDLAEVFRTWPTLSDSARQQILAIVREESQAAPEPLGGRPLPDP